MTVSIKNITLNKVQQREIPLGLPICAPLVNYTLYMQEAGKHLYLPVFSFADTSFEGIDNRDPE